QPRVDLFQDRVELEPLRYAKAEPIREDAGDRLVRRGAVLGDERGLAARVGANPLREHGLRRGDREPEVDESGVGLVDEHLDLARLRWSGRWNGLFLRLSRRRFRLRCRL